LATIWQKGIHVGSGAPSGVTGGIRSAAIRGQKGRPLLKQIKKAIEAARVQALPSSALAKGCNYTLTLWSRLTRFLDYPQLESSNNLAENAIRPVALGRSYE
jgi:transposase